MVTTTNDLTTRNAKNRHNDCQYSSSGHRKRHGDHHERSYYTQRKKTGIMTVNIRVQITGNSMVTTTNDLTTRNAKNRHNDCQYSSSGHRKRHGDHHERSYYTQRKKTGIMTVNIRVQITGNSMVTTTNDLTTRNAKNRHNDCQYSSSGHRKRHGDHHERSYYTQRKKTGIMTVNIRV